ncbi:MAG: XshC-Cox1-family protein [Deltaproteobacteria bacterium]|nr:XshC-Cox1-family protein [Deltaproteobacteria bacterium]|tara:strand:- start:1846 stop:2646 length:801 start_codon:yes stop_codon:yes gene_type:complete
MSDEYFQKITELNAAEVPFAVATVIKITGSVSAKPGAKSIINDKGETLFGWVGGGCAEEAVREASLESMRDGETRIIPLDLDDEILGVGMPCGGTMEVYVEPYLPRPELIIVGHGRIAEILTQLAHLVHFSVTINDNGATREAFPMADKLITSDLDFSQLIVGPKTYVVVVTQHKGDQHSIKKALEGKGPYIGLVASTKRAKLVFEFLLDEGITLEDLKRVHSPAGLDFAGTTPEEIALSIISEMVTVRRGGTAKPMMKIKEISPV